MKSTQINLIKTSLFLIALMLTFLLFSSCEAKIKSLSQTKNTKEKSKINQSNVNKEKNLLYHSSEKITKLQTHQISEKTTQFLQSKTESSLQLKQNPNPSYNSNSNNNYFTEYSPSESNQIKYNDNNNYNNNNNDNNYSKDPEANYGSARNIACTQYNCNFPNVCIQNNSVCKCSVEYAEYELNKPRENGEEKVIQVPQGYLFCSYRKKNQLVYFLLEMLMNIGAGHFYASNYILGGLKISLIFIPCIIFCVLLCLGIAVGDKVQAVFGVGFCLICMLFCSSAVWWLVDIILIGIRKYTDGNGVPLNPW